MVSSEQAPQFKLSAQCQLKACPPVTSGSRASVMNLHMLGCPPWMSRAITSKPYSSAALSLPMAAASLHRRPDLLSPGTQTDQKLRNGSTDSKDLSNKAGDLMPLTQQVCEDQSRGCVEPDLQPFSATILAAWAVSSTACLTTPGRLRTKASQCERATASLMTRRTSSRCVPGSASRQLWISDTLSPTMCRRYLACSRMHVSTLPQLFTRGAGGKLSSRGVILACTPASAGAFLVSACVWQVLVPMHQLCGRCSVSALKAGMTVRIHKSTSCLKTKA